jgi:crotonobetainyl-CoA:carnitine CoA-transferase CaiB-like acyl-CoA transferase
MEKHAFSKIRIIDCTQGISGPYCTKLFADFGAEVIKIEHPNEGDPARKIGPFQGDAPHLEKSVLFFYLNTNKKSITLNLETRAGVDLFKKLLQGVDVVIENLGPGKMSALGLSDENLKQVQPDIVVMHISAFGGSGPYRDYKESNLILYGLGGAMYTMRTPEKPFDRPVIEGGLQSEYITGLVSFIAAVAALFNRECKGQGTEIDVGAMEAVSSVLAAHISEYSYMGLSRRTNPWPIHGYPIGYSVPCRDGWISLTPGLGGAPNIANLIEEPDLKNDPLFSKPAARMAEPQKFDARVKPWMEKHDKWEIAKKAQALRLAFTPVLTGREVLEDVQLKAREYLSSCAHPIMGQVTYPGAPAKLSQTPWRRGRSPLLGEHNKEVYMGLDYSEEDLFRMQEEKII